jgi:hypothetical protein
MTPKRPESTAEFYYQAFALPLRSSVPLPGLAPSVPDPHAVSLELTPRSQIERLWSGGDTEPVWVTAFDGEPYTMRLGRAGDYLMSWGDDTVFLLSPTLRKLRFAPGRRSEAAWQRLLLDTVLWSTSLLNGIELMHASAVQGANGVTAFAALSGAGKTSLAHELMRRGATFFTDDILALPWVNGRLRAHPGPALMNVPRELGDCASLRTVIARFPQEDWIAVPDASVEPNSIVAICLLRRRPRAPLALRRVEPTVLDLLPYTLGFPHLQGRMRQRFMLHAKLAAEVPVYELSAPLDARPDSLADLAAPLVFGSAPREEAA